MPLITRLFLKTGLIFFVVSLLLGIIQQIDALTVAALVPLFWHMLMVGWITQVIIGVSLWMFPGRIKDEKFHNQRWAWITYFLLNIGLILRVVSEPMLEVSGAWGWKITLAISAVLQFMALLSYIREIWPRIMSKKQRIKKKRAKRKS
ncbi:MAG: cbb3-type cytochrome c oxidase subunit I [Balneolaceae bacterium]|nr:cbb3-type cytochrome c oxidase subunit I [Balneolaceae bacterium]